MRKARRISENNSEQTTGERALLLEAAPDGVTFAAILNADATEVLGAQTVRTELLERCRMGSPEVDVVQALSRIERIGTETDRRAARNFAIRDHQSARQHGRAKGDGTKVTYIAFTGIPSIALPMISAARSRRC